MDQKQKTEEGFSYTYSAREHQAFRREVEAIQARYDTKDSREDGLKQLRRLDRKAQGASVAAALTFGIVGVLVFGAGMSISLVLKLYLPGSLIGILGLLLMGAAYPAKKILEKKGKEKYGPMILELSRELLENNKQ